MTGTGGEASPQIPAGQGQTTGAGTGDRPGGAGGPGRMTGGTAPEPPAGQGGAAAARLRAFGAFWYDFLIGDDWLLAVAVLAGLALTWLLHRAGTAAWWLLPLIVAAALAFSIRRAARH